VRRIASIALALSLTAAGAGAGTAQAQPVDLPIPAAKTDKFPKGVRVAKGQTPAVYVDAKGRVLYGMDMRTLLRWAPDPSQYCEASCAETWEPLLAPRGSEVNIRFPANGEEAREPTPPAMPGEKIVYRQADAPDWTVIAGPQGPQWVYKGWHMVFTRRGEQPGVARFDGADEMTWNTLKYVPPTPQVAVPPNIEPRVIDGEPAFTDSAGRVLFTGACAQGCAGWEPFAAGLASAPVGDWQVDRGGDVPRWSYRGHPVFVSSEDDPSRAPAAGRVLRP
jgi:predicted lipoprotein with Yx(FWY)xxD motif